MITSFRSSGSKFIVFTSLLTLLASCGVSPRHTINAKSAASEIANRLHQEYGANPVVTCPAGVRDQAKTSFSCHAVIDGQGVTLLATIKSGSHLAVAPTSAIIPVASVARSLEQDIASLNHVTPSVSCGSTPVLVEAVGSDFSCQATFPGQPPRAVTVTVKNLVGSFTYSLAPASSSSR